MADRGARVVSSKDVSPTFVLLEPSARENNLLPPLPPLPQRGTQRDLRARQGSREAQGAGPAGAGPTTRPAPRPDEPSRRSSGHTGERVSVLPVYYHLLPDKSGEPLRLD